MAQWNSKKWARINWKNRPSTSTALGATNLNKIDVFLNEADNQFVDINASKLNIATANSMIASLTIDVNSGVITARQLDGTTYTWDLNLEKIPVSFALSEDGVLTMTTEDGTQFTADIGELIKDYTFIDSETVGFSKTAAGSGYNVTGIVKEGSIKEKHLDPNYLSSIQQDMNTAQTAANDSLTYSKDSKRWAVGDSGYEGSEIDNSEYYSKLAELAKIAAEKARDEAQAVSNVEIATTQRAGIVKPDGETLGVAEDGTISSIIKAASLLITDNEGLKVSAGQETTTQLLIDSIADKIANHIVTNEALASQLTDYVSKAMISNQVVNDAMKVTGSALSYAQQLEIERLNGNLVTLEIPSQPPLASEAAINDYYNTVSDGCANTTYYRRVVSHGVSHSVLSGGVFYLEGFRVNSSYEWQIARTYNNRIFYRDKITGVWRAWQKLIITSDLRYGTITTGNLTANAITTMHVNFGQELTRKPFVLAYMQNSATDSNNYYWVTNVTNITASGFDVTVKNTLNQTVGLNSTRCVKWIAMAQ